MLNNTNSKVHSEANAKTSAAIQKWGGMASLLLGVVLIVPELIYLMGNLREANGLLTYALADFLYGPVKAASLVMAFYALRVYLGNQAPRQMSLALSAATLASLLFVMAAVFRATNRQYHLHHPELHLENAQTVLLIWTTLVTGIIATGWHVLGWSWLLLGWAGWATGRLPRVLNLLYVGAGVMALFVYLQPVFEGGAIILGVVASIWQGALLWHFGDGD